MLITWHNGRMQYHCIISCEKLARDRTFKSCVNLHRWLPELQPSIKNVYIINNRKQRFSLRVQSWMEWNEELYETLNDITYPLR